jgi:hypothetical protein
MYVEKKNQFTSINSGTHGKKYRYSWKEIAIAITAITTIPPIKNLYYWFSVGEGTLPPHYLIAQNTPLIMYVEKKINSRQSIAVLMERNIGTH